MRESFGKENVPQKKHERLYMRDGKLYTKDELEELALRNEEDDTEAEGGAFDPERRKFLARALAAGAAVAAPAAFVEYSKRHKESEHEAESTEETSQPNEDADQHEDAAERLASGLDVFEQLAVYEEIVDIEAAIEAMEEAHLNYLLNTEKGRARLSGIVRQLERYDLSKLEEPFLAKGLPPWIAVALPAQESDWIPRTSPAGAIGTHQFMPRTITAMGYKKEDALDPYKASEMAALYLDDDRKRYGDDLYLLFSAYNAGAGLGGFQKHEQDRARRKDRSVFYSFIAERLMESYKQIKEEGFVFSDAPAYEAHTVEPGDTMWSLSKRYGVDMEAIAAASGVEDLGHIIVGQKLTIPYKNELEAELRTRNSKLFEMFEYAPQLIAKQDALAALGAVAHREGSRTENIQIAMREPNG